MTDRSKLLPILVGSCVFNIVKRFSSEEVEGRKTNPQSDLKGGGKLKRIKAISKAITKKVLRNKPLLIALVVAFSFATIQSFQTEVETLLTEEVWRYVCTKDSEGNLKVKIVCDIIKNHALNLDTQSMESLIVSDLLTREEKISLLKIKLDCIINGPCSGKGRFLLMIVLALVMSLTISGIGGLALLLEALYRLFREGRISRSLYYEIINILPRIWGVRVPIDHFLD